MATTTTTTTTSPRWWWHLRNKMTAFVFTLNWGLILTFQSFGFGSVNRNMHYVACKCSKGEHNWRMEIYFNFSMYSQQKLFTLRANHLRNRLTPCYVKTFHFASLAYTPAKINCSWLTEKLPSSHYILNSKRCFSSPPHPNTHTHPTTSLHLPCKACQHHRQTGVLWGKLNTNTEKWTEGAFDICLVKGLLLAQKSVRPKH